MGDDMTTVAPDATDALLEHVLASIREPVIVTDRLGEIVCASDSAATLLGSEARLDGRPLVSFVQAADRPAFRTLLGDPGGAAQTLTLIAEGGTPVSVVSEVSAAGTWVFWSLEDVHSQRAALNAVFERLADGLSEGVLAVDQRLEIVVANRSALGLGDFRVGDPLPGRWGNFDLGSFAAALFGPSAMHAEAVVVIGDRSFTLIGMPTHRRTRAVLLITDTSERERRERREREFVANAAHELQTPLTAIVGAVDVLHAGALDDPVERDRFLEHLRRESERLVRLVQSLLLLARAGSEPAVVTEPVPVRPLLDDIAAELNPSPGVTVEVLAPRGLTMRANRDLVERALTNLAENAVRHTETGRILLSGRASRGGIVLEVTDTGAGIPREERELATERFFRGGSRHAAGFGLGLAIVQQVADVLGGTFELKSTPGAGTVGRLRLPTAS
jgi:signal transduction histidine kinase